jgi:hypothetical protein
MSLNAIASPAAREPAPLVTRVRNRIVENARGLRPGGGLRGRLRVERIDPAPPSPARAANHGLRLAGGGRLGPVVDGAWLASPGLLAEARRAAFLAPRPVITAPAFHLGPVRHTQAAEAGYDRTAEDRLF